MPPTLTDPGKGTMVVPNIGLKTDYSKLGMQQK